MRITVVNLRFSLPFVLAVLCMTPPPAFATVGPVNYYPADGNANDVAGSINGAIVGSVAFVPGKVGQAFSFTGSGYVDLTAGIGNFGVADFSLAMWVKPDPTFTTTPIFAKRRPSSTGILNLLLQSDGTPFFEVRDDDANVGCCGFAFISTQNIVDGQWHHLALVRQGPSIVLFIDGAPAPGTTFTQGTTVDLSSAGYTSQTFALGASLPFSLFYSGLMDEFRVYDRALSAAEVQSLSSPPSNQPPDVSGAVPSIATISPPNNKMVSIDILGVTDPDGDPVSIQITAITNNETGSADASGVGTQTAQVRATRFGKGAGRTYTISFVASDGNGGTTPGSVTVFVPHNM